MMMEQYLTNEGKMCAVGRCMLPAREKVEAWVGTGRYLKTWVRGNECALLKDNRASSEFWADLQVYFTIVQCIGMTRVLLERETESGGLLQGVSCCSAPRESEENFS
jgi:hypothetical protein